MTMQTLPLNTLILSKLNVRHTERDADIAALAEDIAARGLKQNLVVVPAHWSTAETGGMEPKANISPVDQYEVIAGGRRFQAMQLLVADGRLPADHPVPCLLEEREDASETSLSENLHKVAMNPADEFAAFKAIVDQRMSPKHGESESAAVAYTAKRFGATVRHVEGRLRLATLCPEVLDALRTDVIGIDAAKAYAMTTDHDLQRRVFADNVKHTWKGHNPRIIREDIRGRTLPLDAPLAQFVGLIAYKAAGGRIESEMFMGADGGQRLVDVALLEKLARECAEAAIPALVKADGLKEGLYAPGIGWQAKWPKPPKAFVKNWGDHTALSKAKRKQLIGIYALDREKDGDGHTLQLLGTYKPEEAGAAGKVEERDWEAERKEAQRERAITTIAARMALPSIEGTPWQDIVYWPQWNPLDICDDDHTFVYVKLKVRNTEIDQYRPAATRQLDEEAEAAEAARIAALAEEFPDHIKPVAEPAEAEG